MSDDFTFVKIIDQSGNLRILNMLHICQVSKGDVGWTIKLGGGEMIGISDFEADQLLSRLPGIREDLR